MTASNEGPYPERNQPPAYMSSRQRQHGTQYLYTALGWRCSSSLRRKRREVICTGTCFLVPVPGPSLLGLHTNPHNSDARRRLPLRNTSAPVPKEGLAIGVTGQTRVGAHPRDQAHEKQCRRAARHQQLLNPVSGERHEDLHDREGKSPPASICSIRSEMRS